MTLKKKTLKKGGNIIKFKHFSLNQIYQQVKHLKEGQEIAKKILNAKNKAEYEGLFNKITSLATIKGKNASNVPKTKHYTFVKPTASLTDKVAAGTAIAGVTGVALNTINETKNQLKSYLSNKESVETPEVPATSKPTKTGALSSLLNKIQNIDIKKVDSKTAIYLSSLIGIAVTGRIFYKKLTKQKITKQELEIEKLVEKEQSTPVKSPKKKSLINKIIKYGAIPLAGVMAVSQLKKTLKK